MRKPLLLSNSNYPIYIRPIVASVYGWGLSNAHTRMLIHSVPVFPHDLSSREREKEKISHMKSSGNFFSFLYQCEALIRRACVMEVEGEEGRKLLPRFLSSFSLKSDLFVPPLMLPNVCADE
jgi:hypothetical protein